MRFEMYGTVIRSLRKKKGLTQEQLADLIGVAGSAVTQWEKDKSKPKLRNLQRMADLFGVTLDDIISAARIAGKETATILGDPGLVPPNARITGQAIAPAITGFPNDVPAYGTASAGPDGRFELNAGEPIDWVRRPPRLARARAVFVIYVEGISMMPVFEPGDTAYAHPGMPIHPGDYVLLVMKPTEEEPNPAAYLKRLVKKTADKWIVEQFNSPKEMSFKASDIGNAHLVLRPNDLLKG